MTSVSLYFVMLLIPLFEAARFRCDYSYTPCGGWFKLHPQPTDHNTAKRICLREGAELVSPLTEGLKEAILSLLVNSDVAATHIDYEAMGQRNKVRQEVSKSTFYNDNVIPMDEENTILALTKKGSIESRPALAQIHFICYKNAGSAEELNECGTADNEVGSSKALPAEVDGEWLERCLGGSITPQLILGQRKTAPTTACWSTVIDNDFSIEVNREYTLDIRTGNCYKFHHIRKTWYRAKEICTHEGGNLAVINNDTEAQVMIDLINSNNIYFISEETKPNLTFVGLISVKKGQNWRTVDGYPLSMSGYKKWGFGEPINAKGDELCGTVKSNGLLYDHACDQEVPFICEKKIQDCNDKYTPDSRTGNCYKFHRSRITYDQARVMCMYEGGNLAVINSESDAQAIGDLFNRNPSSSISGGHVRDLAFLGKHDHTSKTVDGDYLKMSGYNWAPGHLKQAVDNDKCVTVKRNGLLFANQCTLEVPFICEKTNQGCDGYTLDTRTGNCYKFHRIANTWSRAFDICTHEGGNLAVINNETEAQFIRYLFNGNPPDSIPQYQYGDVAFLGLKRDDAFWEWITVDGGVLWTDSSTSGYHKWAPGEPNNAHGDEYCVTVKRNGLLCDDPCDRQFPFICEKKNEDCL